MRPLRRVPKQRLRRIRSRLRLSLPKSVVSQNRAEGIRLFKLAGRPTKEQFILVYGERGAKMTWDERAKAGVPAAKFQAAAAKGSGR